MSLIKHKWVIFMDRRKATHKFHINGWDIRNIFDPIDSKYQPDV